MSELIDRQALKDYVSSLSTHPLNEWDTWGVLAAIDKQPTVTASLWRKVEELPKESGKQYVVWASKGYAYCDKWLGDRWLISNVAPETVTHWMPIEPPKEDA